MHSPIIIALEKLFSCLFFWRKSFKSVHFFGILQIRSKVNVQYGRRYQKPIEKKYSFMPNSFKFFRSSVTSQKQAWFFLVCLCWSAIYTVLIFVCIDLYCHVSLGLTKIQYTSLNYTNQTSILIHVLSIRVKFGKLNIQ